jgi:hypothetical protein
MFEPLHHPCSPTLWGSHVKIGGSGWQPPIGAQISSASFGSYWKMTQNELVYASKTKPTFHPPALGRSWITRQKWTDCCAACVTQPKCHPKLQYYKYHFGIPFKYCDRYLISINFIILYIWPKALYCLRIIAMGCLYQPLKSWILWVAWDEIVEKTWILYLVLLYSTAKWSKLRK